MCLNGRAVHFAIPLEEQKNLAVLGFSKPTTQGGRTVRLRRGRDCGLTTTRSLRACRASSSLPVTVNFSTLGR